LIQTLVKGGYKRGTVISWACFLSLWTRSRRAIVNICTRDHKTYIFITVSNVSYICSSFYLVLSVKVYPAAIAVS
jgi:hypothetical protein